MDCQILYLYLNPIKLLSIICTPHIQSETAFLSALKKGKEMNIWHKVEYTKIISYKQPPTMCSTIISPGSVPKPVRVTLLFGIQYSGDLLLVPTKGCKYGVIALLSLPRVTHELFNSLKFFKSICLSDFVKNQLS